MLKKWFEKIVLEVLHKHLPTLAGIYLRTLDPKKSYVMVLPTSLDTADVKDAIEPLRGIINLVVIQADQVDLIEFGGRQS